MSGPTLPESVCPRCGYLTDDATSVGDPELRPNPGSISICMKCAHITKFAEDLTLVELTRADEVELGTNSEFMVMYSKIRTAIAVLDFGGKQR